MVTKSKLKMALVSEKGVDFKKLKEKKKEKAAKKTKAQKSGDKAKSKGEDAEQEWEDFDDEMNGNGVDLSEEASGSDEVEGGIPTQVSRTCASSANRINILTD